MRNARPVKRKDGGLDALAKAVASGKITITNIRVRACLDCARKGLEGTFVLKSTPNWMNRAICDTCGKKISL